MCFWGLEEQLGFYCFFGKLHLSKQVYFYMWTQMVGPLVMPKNKNNNIFFHWLKKSRDCPLAIVGDSEHMDSWFSPPAFRLTC